MCQASCAMSREKRREPTESRSTPTIFFREVLVIVSDLGRHCGQRAFELQIKLVEQLSSPRDQRGFVVDRQPGKRPGK
jgi:hypothetical protein